MWDCRDNDWMSKKKTGIHIERWTVQSSPLPLQFTCCSQRPGLILSETGLLRGGTIALFDATGLCRRGRYDPSWPSSMEQSQDAGGGHPPRTSSRPQEVQFLGQRARPPIWLLLLLPNVAKLRLEIWSNSPKAQNSLFLPLHEQF